MSKWSDVNIDAPFPGVSDYDFDQIIAEARERVAGSIKPSGNLEQIVHIAANAFIEVFGSMWPKVADEMIRRAYMAADLPAPDVTDSLRNKTAAEVGMSIAKRVLATTPDRLLNDTINLLIRDGHIKAGLTSEADVHSAGGVLRNAFPVEMQKRVEMHIRNNGWSGPPKIRKGLFPNSRAIWDLLACVAITRAGQSGLIAKEDRPAETFVSTKNTCDDATFNIDKILMGLGAVTWPLTFAKGMSYDACKTYLINNGETIAGFRLPAVAVDSPLVLAVGAFASLWAVTAYRRIQTSHSYAKCLHVFRL